ncbi:Uncharacterised protein [Chlamydia trachomatis]|nr:Uncharacterised protein [Chlamydia trachomatis]
MVRISAVRWNEDLHDLRFVDRLSWFCLKTETAPSENHFHAIVTACEHNIIVEHAE